MAPGARVRLSVERAGGAVILRRFDAALCVLSDKGMCVPGQPQRARRCRGDRSLRRSPGDRQISVHLLSSGHQPRPPGSLPSQPRLYLTRLAFSRVA